MCLCQWKTLLALDSYQDRRPHPLGTFFVPRHQMLDMVNLEDPMDKRLNTRDEAHSAAADLKIERRQEIASRRRPQTNRAEAESAIRTLISWADDDPARHGLIDTPARVARAFSEWVSGSTGVPEALLTRTFDETCGYQQAVELQNIPFHSYCEHHLTPIRGKAHIAYLSSDNVVGISKLARVVDVFSRRLKIQERLTNQIANAINSALLPSGVAVVLVAEHGCMTTRGIQAHGTRMVAKCMIGAYQDDADLRREFLSSLDITGRGNKN